MPLPPSVQRLTQRLYATPIIRNSARGELVEEIVAMALEPEWQLCSGDWGACDLVHPASGLRMQVKQSAARQSWHGPDAAPTRGHFSIAHKTGRYEDDGSWTEQRSRNADLFVFAWHPRTDPATDHRDPDQWRFFVVSETALPPTQSLILTTLRRLATDVSFDDLKRAVIEQISIRPLSALR